MKNRKLLALIALVMSLIMAFTMCGLADEIISNRIDEIPEAVTPTEVTVEVTPEVPAAEEPAAEETATGELATEEPVAEETATEEAAIEEAATEEAAAEEAATEESVTEETATEESVTEEPATEEPVTEEIAATEEAATEEPEAEAGSEETVTAEETALRAEPDGMSEIIAILPEGTSYTVLSREGDWCLVQAGDACGYLFSAATENIEARVTIFTSRTPNLALGQEIVLTSELTGVPEETEVRYQWQYDRGFGFENVPDANEAYYTFEASMDTLSYTWRLKVTLVDPVPAENAEG